MKPAKAERLRGKITKDRADILALLDPQPRKYVVKEDFDNDAFYHLVKRLDLEFILETITELPKHGDSVQLYNPTLNAKQMQKWIRKVIK